MKNASNLLRKGSVARDMKSSMCALLINYISWLQLQEKCYDTVEIAYFLPLWKTLLNNQIKRENALFQHVTGNICVHTTSLYTSMFDWSWLPLGGTIDIQKPKWRQQQSLNQSFIKPMSYIWKLQPNYIYSLTGTAAERNACHLNAALNQTSTENCVLCYTLTSFFFWNRHIRKSWWNSVI